MSAFIDKKYIDLVSAQLRNFKWKRGNLANCSCPVCGDSQSNKRKARGFFFQKGNDFFYMCHNCGFSSNIHNFLKEVSPSYAKEYSLERWKSGEDGKSNYQKPVFKMEPTKFQTDKTSLVCLTELPKMHPAVVFVRGRNIPQDKWSRLFYTEDFGGFAKTLDPSLDLKKREPRLVIPFFDSNGNIIAAQGRLLKPAGPNDIRYMTIKGDKSIERLWYGINECDPNKRVYVVEGPLDSLFLPNAVAMVGAAGTKLHPKIANADVVVALDNEPRNREIVSLMEKFIDSGIRICVWKEGISEKDINDMVLNGLLIEDIVNTIDTHSCSGMEAKLKLNFWKKV
jgi:hypothetical protein